MKADILIKNGRIIDPYGHRDEIGDVAVLGGKIADPCLLDGAVQTVDASGCVVCPGLIDFHAHVASAVADMSVNPMVVAFPNGVTTLVDAGSSGTANYEAFRAFSLLLPVRIMAMLHLSPEGNVTSRHPENQDPDFWDTEKVKRFIRRYGDQLIGIKIRLDNNVLGGLGMKPLLAAVKLRDEIGCPLICHVTNPPIPMDELITYFKPGDVFTHVFHGVGYTILDERGRVFPAIRRAQEDGVLMDAANGRKNFSANVARAAIREGFLPDILSTDLTAASAFVDNQNVVSLPFIMSKYLALGLSLPEVIRRTTEIPAKTLGLLPRVGCLSQGACGDITVLKEVSRRQVFTDKDGVSITGERLLKPEMTIKDGVCVFRQIDFY